MGLMLCISLKTLHSFCLRSFSKQIAPQLDMLSTLQRAKTRQILKAFPRFYHSLNVNKVSSVIHFEFCHIGVVS